MEECARLNGKTIAGMDWSQVTPVLYTVNVPKEQNTDDNPSDVAAGEDGFVRSCYGGSSAGSFSLAFKDLGRGGGEIPRFIPRHSFFFFFKWRVSSRTPIPLSGQVHSTVAQRAETTVAECFLRSCV